MYQEKRKDVHDESLDSFKYLDCVNNVIEIPARVSSQREDDGNRPNQPR